MESKMSAIEKLKLKIEELKTNFNELHTENRGLKAELESGAGSNEEELNRLKELLETKEKQILQLKNEITEKDTEIEAIIAKVETLLG
jgi:predicted RNase H-like nuclease (RuvC/YqgF family)